MNAVGKLSTYISQGVYSVAGPFHPFGGAIDIIAVQQQDGGFKSTPWNVKFGKFQGVLNYRENVVRVAVNEVDADFHMYLDHKGEAYFLEDSGPGNDSRAPSPSASSAPSSGDEGSLKPLAIEYPNTEELEADEKLLVQNDLFATDTSSVSCDEGLKVNNGELLDSRVGKALHSNEGGADVNQPIPCDHMFDGLNGSYVTDSKNIKSGEGALEVTRVSSDALASSRAVSEVLPGEGDKNVTPNQKKTHSLLNTLVGLEEGRVSGPASALVANSTFTSFVKVASTSDQPSSGSGDVTSLSHISKSANGISVVESDSLAMLESTETDFQIPDSSKIFKTDTDPEVNSGAAGSFHSGTEFNTENIDFPSACSVDSQQEQFGGTAMVKMDNVEENLKCMDMKTPFVRQGMSVGSEVYMEDNAAPEENRGASSEKVLSENEQIEGPKEDACKRFGQQEEPENERYLSTDGKILADQSPVVHRGSPEDLSMPIADSLTRSHTEPVIDQERAWRRVLEKAAIALKDIQTTAKLDSRAITQQADLQESGAISSSLEKKSWGWWGWRGSASRKKQMIDKPERRSSRLSRKLSGRNFKTIKDSPIDASHAETQSAGRDSLTKEMILGPVDFREGFPSGIDDKQIDIDVQSSTLLGHGVLNDSPSSLSEEGTYSSEIGMGFASVPSHIDKTSGDQAINAKLGKMRSKQEVLKPSRSILSRVFGGSGRAQSDLQQQASVNLKNMNIEEGQQKESLVVRAEIIAELLDSKWSSGKSASQVSYRESQNLPLPGSSSLLEGSSVKSIDPVDLEEGNKNVEDDASHMKTLSVGNMRYSESGEKDDQFSGRLFLPEGTRQPLMQEQAELFSCKLYDSSVENEMAFSLSNSRVTSGSHFERVSLFDSNMVAEVSIVPEGCISQVDLSSNSAAFEKVGAVNPLSQEVGDIDHPSEIGCGAENDVVEAPSDSVEKNMESPKRADYILQQDNTLDATAILEHRTSPFQNLERGSNEECESFPILWGVEADEDVRSGSQSIFNESFGISGPGTSTPNEDSMLDGVKSQKLEIVSHSNTPDQWTVSTETQVKVDSSKGAIEQVDSRTDGASDAGSQTSCDDALLLGMTSSCSSDLHDTCAAASAVATDHFTDEPFSLSSITIEKPLGTQSQRQLSFKDVEVYYETFGSNIDSPINGDTGIEEDFKSCLALPDLLGLSGENEDVKSSYKVLNQQPALDVGSSDQSAVYHNQLSSLVKHGDSMRVKVPSAPVDIPRVSKNDFQWPSTKHLSESMPNLTGIDVKFEGLMAQKFLSSSLGTHPLLDDRDMKSEFASVFDDQACLTLVSNMDNSETTRRLTSLDENFQKGERKAAGIPLLNSLVSAPSLSENSPSSYGSVDRRVLSPGNIDMHPATFSRGVSLFETPVSAAETGFELSLCKHLLAKGMGKDAAMKAFDSEKVPLERFKSSGTGILGNEKLVVRVGGRYYPWTVAAPIIVGMLAFGQFVLPNAEGEIEVEAPAVKYSKTVLDASTASAGLWKLWPFLLGRPKTPEKGSYQSEALAVASNLVVKPSSHKNGYNGHQLRRHRVRTKVPTSKQLASLNLKEGRNKITFTFFTNMLGRQQVDAHIYLWKWNARIVISDVDGTITKSDVLGQVMPLVGKDWTQTGVTRLFSAIKDNGYELMFLSARAISQAYLTRQFLLNLKQDGEPLPDGPVVISPDGLFPSLYREVIRRAPHEFKIACLKGIRALFPSERNPFYAGFGNRDTDEFSYLEVGIPRGKIFIINPKGEVIVNNVAAVKTYPSLHKLANDMFPPASYGEQEDFNSWNYWKMPLLEIDDEMSTKSSNALNSKLAGSSRRISQS